MSEMRGVDTTKLENEQAQTTQGLAATTASIKKMDGTISAGDQGTHSRLDAIAKVLSIESPAEKQMREQSAEAARAAEARFQELIRLQESGNATEEQVLDAQRAMEEAQQEANEAATKRSMFDRLSLMSRKNNVESHRQAVAQVVTMSPAALGKLLASFSN